MSEEVNHKVGDARKTVGALMNLWKRRYIFREAKASIYDGIVEPSLLL